MKKFIKITAAFIAALIGITSLCSCSLTDLFEKAGITAVEQTTDAPETEAITYPETEENLEQADLSEIDLTQYMTLDYKGLELTTTYEKRVITDDVLKSEIAYLLVQSSNYTLITDRKTAIGDWLEISFTGIMDGEEFSGGSSDKATILLDMENSGYIDGFAEGLVGVQPGETVSLDLTFPETYYSDLANKAVTFKVTVKGICGGDLTDELASTLSSGKYTTVDTFKTYFKTYLEELEDSQVLSDVYSQIWSALEAKAVFTGYPEDQYKYYYNSYINYIISYAQESNIDFETAMEYMGQTYDTLKELALDNVHQDMILNYVANEEKLELTDEGYQNYLEDMVSYYNDQGYSYTADDIEEIFDSYYGTGYLKAKAFEEMVCTSVYKYATVTYSAATEETTAAQ